MLSRRRFGACALCAAVGLSAVAVGGPAQAAGSGLKRTILQRTDFPGDQYVTLLVLVEIAGGTKVPRHTHPGVESTYVLEGGFELFVKGEPDRTFKASDGFQIPPETPHSVTNGEKTSRLIITYVVDKNKPLASPAPE